MFHKSFAGTYVKFHNLIRLRTNPPFDMGDAPPPTLIEAATPHRPLPDLNAALSDASASPSPAFRRRHVPITSPGPYAISQPTPSSHTSSFTATGLSGVMRNGRRGRPPSRYTPRTRRRIVDTATYAVNSRATTPPTSGAVRTPLSASREFRGRQTTTQNVTPMPILNFDLASDDDGENEMPDLVDGSSDEEDEEDGVDDILGAALQSTPSPLPGSARRRSICPLHHTPLSVSNPIRHVGNPLSLRGVEQMEVLERDFRFANAFTHVLRNAGPAFIPDDPADQRALTALAEGQVLTPEDPAVHVILTGVADSEATITQDIQLFDVNEPRYAALIKYCGALAQRHPWEASFAWTYGRRVLRLRGTPLDRGED